MVYFASASYLKKTYQGGNAVFVASLGFWRHHIILVGDIFNRKVEYGRKIVILRGWSYRCAPMARPIKSSYWSVAAPRISRSLVRKESGNNELEVSLLIQFQPWEQNVSQLILERHSSWNELWKVPGGLKKTCHEKLEIDIPWQLKRLELFMETELWGLMAKLIIINSNWVGNRWFSKY